MFGSSLLIVNDKLQTLGLSSSDRDTSIRWCGCSPDLIRDYRRRDGAFARVAPRTVAHLRERLHEVAEIVPSKIAARRREIDSDIVRDERVFRLLGRRCQR